MLGCFSVAKFKKVNKSHEPIYSSAVPDNFKSEGGSTQNGGKKKKKTVSFSTLIHVIF
jgi:hypothetical protein